MKLHPLLESLSHGDKRMVIGVEEAVSLVLKDSSLFPILIDGLINDSELIAMRSADAIEKLTSDNHGWLQPHKNTLMKLIKNANQQEVRWHLCQIIPRLSLSLKERIALTEEFKVYLTDTSRIVVTFALQAMVDLANEDEKMRSEVVPIIKKMMKDGSPAIQSRGKKLLKQLTDSV